MRISSIYFNLPSPLLLLVFSILARSPSPSLAQAQPATLQLNKLATFSIASTQKSLSIPLPQTTQPIVLSVELCTQIDGQQPPRFFAGAGTGTSGSSSSSSTSLSASASASSTGTPTADDEDELDLGDGPGIWQSDGSLVNGGVLTVQLDQTTTGGTWSFSVGISTDEDVPLHGFSQSLPLYGDATSTSALLFAEPISDTGVPFQEPSFPRYDLPPAIPSSPTAPDSTQSANSTLILVPTSSISSLVAVGGGLLKSSCFLQTLSSSQLAGVTITPSLVLRNQTEGWRTQFLVEGLQPSTNYTSYTITATQGGGQTLSQSASFKTKSSAFQCTLVHSLPFCPEVSWAAPFPPLTGDPTTYDNTNFPPIIEETLGQSLGNFTVSLKTFGCGRDIYSIIQSCASCERAYRNWLCSVLIPRCGETDTSLVPPAALAPRSIESSNTTSTSARLGQTMFSSGAEPVTDYVELLPCLETCHAVDRACPPNIQWTCPREGLGAELSYGVGFVDLEGNDVSGGGVQGGGTTGMSQDVYGNVWCNGIE